MSLLQAGVACRSQPSQPQPAASASAASVPNAPSAARAPAPAAKPWFARSFAGSFVAEPVVVEAGIGALREWKRADSKHATGPGTLELVVSDDGIVTGTATGALGPLSLNGKVDGDTLTATLIPNGEGALGGVLSAGRDGNGFKGTIEASSGDSVVVRHAEVQIRSRD